MLQFLQSTYSECVIDKACDDLTCDSVALESNCEEVYIFHQSSKFNLIHVPVTLKNLRSLIIKSSTIEILKNIFLKTMSKLKSIKFNECYIKSIEKEAFDNLKHLVSLNLNNNLLHNINENTLISLESLEFFSIISNKLESIDLKAFKNSKRLKSIDLSRNQLTQLDTGLFYGLSNLKILIVSKNRLKEINSSLFENNPKLETIDVGFNEITKVDWTIGIKLSQLIQFKMSENACNITFNHWNVCEMRTSVNESCKSKTEQQVAKFCEETTEIDLFHLKVNSGIVMSFVIGAICFFIINLIFSVPDNEFDY